MKIKLISIFFALPFSLSYCQGQEPTIKPTNILNNQLSSLNHCKDRSDCLNIGTKQLGCPIMGLCGGCGTLIHKSKFEEFNKLSSEVKSQATKNSPKCRFYDCFSSWHCLIECVSEKCVGKDVEDLKKPD